MTIIDHDTYKELLPAEGKVLTDGKGYVTAVSVPATADISRWREVDQPQDIEEITAEEALDIITQG